MACGPPEAPRTVGGRGALRPRQDGGGDLNVYVLARTRPRVSAWPEAAKVVNA
jgi:hypothetical protein